MSNAENYILIDGDSGSPSSDETPEVFNGDQNNSPDRDELHKLLGDSFTSEANDPEAMISAEYDSSLVVDESSVSTVEELEKLYGVSGEAGVDDADVSLEADDSSSGDVSDASSLMAEMEALYGNSVETEIDNTETTAETEESADECISDSVSLMQELEELFSSSTESTDTEFSLPTSEPSPTEEDVSSMSALDELKAFLDDTTQAEAGDIETSSVSIPEPSFVSCRSVLDELQNLLQSCIDEINTNELKADAKSTIGNTPVSTDVEYPSRDELQDLLENVLSQLMLFSNSSVVTTSTDSVSVLDELKNFMDETGIADKTEASTESDSLVTDDDFSAANENEAGEYEVSSFDDNVGTEDAGSDSIIDELNLLLGNTSSETPDTVLESDILTSDISDESQVLDELDTYMAESSSDIDISDKTSVDETGAGATDAGLAGASNTLEELEAMLSEISVSSKGKSSDNIKESEDNFSYEGETGQLLADNKEDNSELFDKGQIVEVVTDNTKTGKTAVNTSVEDVDSSHEQNSNNGMPKVGLLFAAVLAAGGYGFWSLLNTGDGINDRSEKSVIQQPQSASEVALEERSDAVIPAEEDSIYDLLAKTEATGYMPMSSYDDESSGIEIIESKVTQKPYEEAYDKEVGNKPLNIESTETEAENEATQNLHEENADKKTGDESKDAISLQIENLQQENRESINRLNKRMIEAETSIVILQSEKTVTNNQKDIIKPASIEVPVKPELVVNNDAIQQPVQKVPVYKVQDMDNNRWSVHLSSYYSSPPPDIELEFLKKAGVSYQIKKTIISDEIWYRVLINNYSEYGIAKKNAEALKKKFGIKKIWVSKN